MKKIIAAIDGLKYSKATTECAISISKLSSAHLVGVFLDDFTYNSYNIYDLMVKKGVTAQELKQHEESDKHKRMKAVQEFEKSCQEAGVNYSLHHDQNFALQELLHESIYADLLVIDSRETLTHYDEALPTGFIRDLLINVQCSVLLLPSDYRPFKKVSLLYDGEPGSVHAIKMFSYLLPEFQSTPSQVITVKASDEDKHLPDNHLMREFMKRHFPSTNFIVLKGNPEMNITDHLRQDDHEQLVVLGAYRRNMVSRWLKPSMADHLMKELKSALFISHNN